MQARSRTTAGVRAALWLVSGTLAEVAVAQDSMATVYVCLPVEGPNRGKPAPDPAVKAGRLSAARHAWSVSEGALP